ncbi:MAG TPA: hypothetical protein VGS59_10215 [Candidatus Acidoferrales bacterium]|nr:hypothetical protein [Candidatus Acidoferrales bacterium]
MPRISGVEAKQGPWHVRVIYWFARRALGQVPAGMKILALYPPLLRQFVRMNVLQQKNGTLPTRLKRLAMLKTALLVGCPF